MPKKKIALVNQRYGLEVNGGSEYYTRLIAERLAQEYEVEVLTSRALSYETWENYYDEGTEQINGVTVRRFGVIRERNMGAMGALTQLLMAGHAAGTGNATGTGNAAGTGSSAGTGNSTEAADRARANKALSDEWVKFQGPRVPRLIDFIRTHKDDYAAIIFVTYLYYPTVFGLPEAKEKAIFIPTAHDEPYIHFYSHARLFDMPRAFIFLTDEEKELVEGLFHNSQIPSIPSIVAGVGVDVPERVDSGTFREKYGIEGDYLIYTGRVDVSKSCDEMFSHFLRYTKENASGKKKADDLTLVVMGREMMEIPENRHIRYLGFVSEEDKFNGVSGAKALWLPSKFESLSISVLEAMSLDVPVLVNGQCEVLKGHCQKSGGGLYYNNYRSCSDAMNVILNEPKKQKEMGRKAGEYIKAYYTWPKIIEDIKGLIEKI